MNKERLLIISLTLLLASSSCAPMFRNYMRHKKEKQWEGGGSGDVFAPYYDTSTVVTISGKIVKVENFIATSMSIKAVRVFVKTKDTEQEVHLGPIWYIAKQPFTLRPGDVITVTGSMLDDKIMAQKLEKNGETFLLRNEEGQPEWFKSMSGDVPKKID